MLKYTAMHGIIAVGGLIMLLPSCLSFAAAQSEPAGPGNGPEKFTGRLSPSIFLLIAIFCTPMFLISVAVILVLWWRRGTTVSEPSLSVLQPRPATGARGLDASAVEALPTFVYADVKNLKVGKGALECAICLSEFDDHETLRLLPKCDHVFHTHCIGAWLSNHVTCPVCRSDLTVEPGGKRITGTEINDIESQTEEGRHEQTVNTEPDQETGDRVSVTVEPVRRVKLLRWNSTGHFVVKPEENENTDRFTLKLPEEIRKKLLGIGEESSKKEKRLNRRQSMSERWLVFKTSSFRWRNGSIVSPKDIDSAEETSIHIKPEGPIRLPV